MLARSNSTIACAVACGSLCALAAVEATWKSQFVESLNGEDEVTLLQERVIERHLSKKLADARPAVEPETKAPKVCDDTTAKVGLPNLENFEDLLGEPRSTHASLSLDFEPLVDNMQGGGSAAEETYARNLRYVLDFLIVLLLLDRCTCWCSVADKLKTYDDGSSGGNPDAFKQLMRVAAAGDEAGTLEMLCVGASVIEKDFWGCTLLHAAAKGGCTQLIAELIDLGAQVDAMDSWDETPLHIASRAGHVDTCAALISRGANMDALNAQSFTPLVVAGSAERNAVASMLIQKGAGVGELAKQDLPLLLQELIFDSMERLLEDVKTQLEGESEEEEEEVRQWPTDEDWEERMKESIDNIGT